LVFTFFSPPNRRRKRCEDQICTFGETITVSENETLKLWKPS